MTGSIFRLCVALAAASTLSSQASAQVVLSPRMLGTGGAFQAAARGQDALLVNPANLALPGGSRWSVSLLNVSVAGTLQGVNANDVRTIMDSAQTDDRSGEVFDRLSSEGMGVNADVRVPALVLQAGSFAAGLSWASVSDHVLSGDAMDLFLNGYEEGRHDYSMRGSVGSYAEFMDLTIGHGRTVRGISTGVAVHFMFNGSIARSRLLDPRYGSDADGVIVPYTEVVAKGGRGFGLDLGVAGQPAQNFTLSASVSNLVGGMWWGNDLYLRERDLQDVDLGPYVAAARFDATERAISSGELEWQEYRTSTGLFDEARLPASFRVGAAYRLLGWGPHVGLTLQRHLTPGWLASGSRQHVAFGAEQSLRIAAVRAGYRTDLDGTRMISGGASAGPLALSAAWLDGTQVGAEQGGLLLSLGLHMRGSIVR